MTSMIPEIIFHILEFPATTLMIWFVLCATWFYAQPLTLILAFLLVPVGLIVSLIIYLITLSRLNDSETKLKKEYQDWIEIVDPALKSWKGKKLPIREGYEWYFKGQINFTRPVLEVCTHRFELFRMILTWGHIMEFIDGVLVKAWLKHDASGDHGEVTPVYNLGNDFYYAFLSDPMFYSCGVAYDLKESLQVVQDRKCGIVAESLQLKDGDRIVDFGCGWGSWLIYAAKHFKIEGHGLTISQKQFDYATKRIKEEGLEDRITIHLIDYREMTYEKFGKFDKITNFEMSEHVGIRNYQEYVAQVKSLLKDDGLFFLQIAGLRRAWQFEDLIWGVFMGKYIFPGADASCPLYWNVNQYERGGFECYHIRNQGVHYAHTIESWYHNIVANKESVEERDGVFAYRRHEWFLAWSTMIARQGSSTVWTMLMTHNHPTDNYSVNNPPHKLNRSQILINREQYNTAH